MTLEGFREHLGRTGSPRTVTAYMRDARLFEVFRRNDPLSVDALERWVASFIGINPQTTSRRLAAVRRWLAFRAKSGDGEAFQTLVVLQSGYQVARGPREADRRCVAALTVDEYHDARARAPEWGRTLMGLLWLTGARISEIIGDGLAGIPALTVEQGRELAERGFTRTRGKGGRVRLLVLPSSGRAELFECIAGREPHSPLFPSPSDPGRPVSKQAFNAALHRAGIAGGAHRFRHGYKARLRKAGVRDELIVHLLGHGPADTTARYGQPDLGELIAAAELLKGG